MERVQRFSRFPAFVILAAVVIGAISGPRAQSSDLAIEGRSNAFPSIASRGRFVAIAWGATTQGGGTDIYVASSVDNGRTFRRPTKVNSPATTASLSGEQPPRITLLAGGRQAPAMVVTWTAKAGRGTRLWTARSDDGGQSFAPPRTWPGTEAAGNRGWQATAADREGVVAVWLDHRELAESGATASAPHSGHQHGGTPGEQRDGVARAQLSKLYFGRLGTGDHEQAITGGVCYCCKTAIATGPDGAIYAAWRHVYPGNVRDIAFTMSRDGGRTFTSPTRVSEDRWVLDGCPENGPAIAVDGRGRIHVVWPTLVPGAATDSEPTLALFYASSRDGVQFTARQRIPTDGFARHPQLALTPRGEALVVWDEQIPDGRRVSLAQGVIDDNGTSVFTRRMLNGERRGSYPMVATTEEGAVAVWTTGAAGQATVHVEYVPQ